ncbi:selT-like protein isoform X2 [Hibiscus syriacus]|nr:selT-like protein isoform X2 [Hibiscus syriacus]
MKKMLETQFPGIDMILDNYPPPLPKWLLSKVVPVFQFGVIGIVMAGEQIFPMIGIMTPSPWYYSLRANRFGSIATAWLLGNVMQSFLLSSGAFEVYCNGELVFSKLKEGRFPGEIELKNLFGKTLANSRVMGNLGVVWS